jgi:hypothetical protein
MPLLRRLPYASFACLLAVCGGGAGCSSGSDSPSTKSSGPGDAGDAGSDGASSADGGSAGLLDLEVAPLTLTPAFSPDIHDYYVRCAAGANALSVTLKPKPGNQVAITAPTSAASSGQEQVSLSVTENQAIVATATAGKASAEYWVRCLPHDFPALTLTTFPKAGTSGPGYYLLGNTFHVKAETGYAIVLDLNAVPVWYHTTLNGAGADNVDVLVKNTISYIGDVQYTFSDVNGAYEVHDLETGALHTVMPTGYPADIHELRRLANGDYLMFSRPIETGVDLVGLGNATANDNMVNSIIHEIDPSGNLVWEWKATDHFDPVKDGQGIVYVSAADGSKAVEVPDPFHFNSIDLTSSGDLLVSSRNMNSIFLISRATGKVVWKLGGSSYTKDGAAFLAVQGDPLGGFFRQHDARFLANGNISLFDDQTGRPAAARAIELSYDVTAGTASIVWQFSGSVASSALGSHRVQADGTHLIGWGLSEGPSPTFTEVGVDGQALRTLTLTTGDTSYRAIKVDTDELDLGLLRKAAGASN